MTLGFNANDPALNTKLRWNAETRTSAEGIRYLEITLHPSEANVIVPTAVEAPSLAFIMFAVMLSPEASLWKLTLIPTKVYTKGPLIKAEIALAKTSPDKFINLDSSLVVKKRELIHNVYGFSVGSFEYNCCQNIEAFDISKN